MDTRPHLSFCACKTAWLPPEILVFNGSSTHLWILHANSVICTRITGLYGFQLLSVVLCMQNSAFRTRLTCLYGSQTSFVVLSTHNSVLSTRLFLFQPSYVVLCMQNSDSLTRITSLCWSKTPPVVFACKIASSGPEWQVSIGPRHDLSFCSHTIAWLASELPVYMGHRPDLWIMIAKQRLLDQHKSLYVYQTWPLALCIQNSVISTRFTSLSGFQHSSVE